MSCGERSCKNKPCPIPDQCNMNTCNVDCPKYEWDGITKPDSISSKPKAEEKPFIPESKEVENKAPDYKSPEFQKEFNALVQKAYDLGYRGIIKDNTKGYQKQFGAYFIVFNMSGIYKCVLSRSGKFWVHEPLLKTKEGATLKQIEEYIIAEENKQKEDSSK